MNTTELWLALGGVVLACVIGVGAMTELDWRVRRYLRDRRDARRMGWLR